MDLIYMNAAKEDIGVLRDFEMDMAFGANENNFECTIQAERHCCQDGYFLYVEGTEYGGEIDNIEIDTANGEITYSGRTWHGILGSKVIYPLQTGESSAQSVTVKTSDASGPLAGKYLVISGDANACIGYIINRAGLSSFFHASAEAAGVNINQFQFDRYTNVYSGLCKMLSEYGMKLNVVFSGGYVVLSAKPKVSYTQENEFDSDQVAFQLKRKYKTVNHLICLGKGDLENRTVVHLYADADGAISQTQTQTGINEYTEVYDYPSAESEEELITGGTNRLLELMGTAELSVDCDESTSNYDVGDMVGALDNTTGISVSAIISKKIVQIKDGTTKILYKVGE